jgi:hypothetical protein
MLAARAVPAYLPSTRNIACGFLTYHTVAAKAVPQSVLAGGMCHGTDTHLG